MRTEPNGRAFPRSILGWLGQAEAVRPCPHSLPSHQQCCFHRLLQRTPAARKCSLATGSPTPECRAKEDRLAQILLRGGRFAREHAHHIKDPHMHRVLKACLVSDTAAPSRARSQATPWRRQWKSELSLFPMLSWLSSVSALIFPGLFLFTAAHVLLSLQNQTMFSQRAVMPPHQKQWTSPCM